MNRRAAACVRTPDPAGGAAVSRRTAAVLVAVAVIAALLAPGVSATASAQSDSDGVAVTRLDVSVNGTTVDGEFVVSTSRRVRFRYLQIAVRDREGRNHDFAHQRNVTLNGSRTFSGSRENLAPGTYTATVAYRLHGSGSWDSAGPTRTFEVGSGMDYNTDGVAVADFGVSVDDRTASGEFTVHTSRPTTFRSLQLAVRDDDDANHDFAHHPGVSIDGSRTFDGSRGDLAAGSYHATVVYRLEGSSTWKSVGPTRTFAIEDSETPPQDPDEPDEPDEPEDPEEPEEPRAGFGPTWGRPFTDGSAWNKPIPSSPALDSNSRAIADYLGGRAGIANLERYGVPVFDADADTPRYDVPCVRWSGCDLEKQPVPIPDNARPAPGGDAQMVVIDWSTRTAYELYRAEKHSDGSWTAGWGGVISVDGDGYKGDAPHLPTGAGVSRLAGVIRTFEVAQREINHALVFSTDNACTNVYRYPAAKTDGLSSRSDCIPEGARVQLDPSIDVDSLPNATPAEKMVAKALQTYGAYAMDNGGARIAVIFQPPYGQPDPYPDVGLTNDYKSMPNIPWHRLRVLRQWDGR